MKYEICNLHLHFYHRVHDNKVSYGGRREPTKNCSLFSRAATVQRPYSTRVQYQYQYSSATTVQFIKIKYGINDTVRTLLDT